MSSKSRNRRGQGPADEDESSPVAIKFRSNRYLGGYLAILPAKSEVALSAGHFENGRQRLGETLPAGVPADWRSAKTGRPPI